MSKVQDLETAGQLGLGFEQGEMTYVPPSDWAPPDPASLPDRLYGTIACDVETRDHDLETKGPGWAWRDGGYVVGYSFKADNWEGYLPIRHQGGGNLDPDLVRRVANRWLGDETQLKVGANALYDVGWSKRDGVEWRGPVHDIQWAEALLDEHRWSYSLDSLAKTYLNEGKDETLLKQAAAAWGVDPKKGMWRLPSMFVGPYAGADANRTRRVYDLQVPKLQGQGLWPLFDLECSLLPVYLEARWRGVRLNVEKVELLRRQWKARSEELLAELRRRTFGKLDVWSATSVARAMDAENLPYPRTSKTGAPSITKLLLTQTDHWLAKGVLEIRELDKLVGTFIDGQLIGHLHEGRIHAEFHPLRADDEEHVGGTIGGRGSMSKPNLQFIPERTEAGREVRRCFEPEPGQDWWTLDYSQQEPRLTVHYAVRTKRGGQHLPGALEARDRYRRDPTTDFHNMAMELTGLPRKPAKILNLAIIYGRGAFTTSEELGVTLEEGKALIAKHHAGMPFAPALARVVKEVVEETGELRTILGRVCRFPFWEPADWDLARKSIPVPKWKAKKQWPGQRLRRAWLHKTLNRLIQGSGADQTKKAMSDAHRAGLMTGSFLMQLHDDLNFSSDSEASMRRAEECMKEAIPLEVPVMVGVKSGPTWGDVG